MVVVDRFIKMAQFIGLEQNATAKDVANVFQAKSGNFMVYQQKLSLIWTQGSLANSGNLFASRSTLSEECRQPTTPKLTDKQKEPTKYWKVTYETF